MEGEVENCSRCWGRWLRGVGGRMDTWTLLGREGRDHSRGGGSQKVGVWALSGEVYIRLTHFFFQ